jgi:glycosyltransferase involved in cell wall biosynthesis
LPKSPASPTHGRLELGLGDAFVGLDLSAHLFFRREGQLRRWSAAGAEIATVVYDLLPLAHPEWFNPKTARYFRRWLDVVGRRANLVLPISRSVQADLAKYLATHHSERASQIRSEVLPLSGDIGQFEHNSPAKLDPVTETMRSRPAVLMVGTVEPRKGYSVALAAHRHAWATSPATVPLLIMAGKAGWQTAGLQRELRGLDLERDGAIWLEDVDDSKLHELYRACRCVLVASHGEGYCLPLHEALAYGKPVLARDLPVLRELHSPLISYFTGDDPLSLAAALVDIATRALPPPTIPPVRGWADTVGTLLHALKVDGR